MKQYNASTTEMMTLFDSYSAISVFHKRKYPLWYPRDNNILTVKPHMPTKNLGKKTQYTVYMYFFHSQTYRAKHADYVFKKI